MKKTACFLILTVICFVLGVSIGAPVFAVDLPYVIIGEGVYLLDIDEGYRLFLLPESYYAPIESMTTDHYLVSFNGIKGKVERSLVSSTGYGGTADGTMQEVKVDSKYSIFTDVKLKSRMDGTSENLNVPVDASLVFLGHYPLSEMWYYVKYNDITGYIPASFTNKPEITIGTFVPETPNTPTQTDPEKPIEGGTSLVKILVITGGCVVAVVLIIIIFKPPKAGKKRYYYED